MLTRHVYKAHFVFNNSQGQELKLNTKLDIPAQLKHCIYKSKLHFTK